jgi:PIN domain nuclease of toxin-antitoxin system
VKLLLDTHTLLWFIEGNPLLSANAASLIAEPFNEVFVSDVSFFEIAIKIKIGKLSIQGDLSAIIYQVVSDDISILSIQHKHLLTYPSIPLFPDHRDPFDRLLIATAHCEGLSIITADEKLSYYQDLVKIIW